MKIEVTITKTYAFLIIIALLFLSSSILVYAAWSQPIDGAWHDSDSIKVTLDGVDWNLQTAFDSKAYTSCAWQLSAEKDSAHGNLPWTFLSDLSAFSKPTGICKCGSSTSATLEEVLAATPSGSGSLGRTSYLETKGTGAGAYLVCDPDNTSPCNSRYFAYLTC